MSGGLLPAELRLGPVHLTVADVDSSVAWYERSLGLRVHDRGDGEASLGDGAETVVVVHEEPGARPPGRHAGLYQYALGTAAFVSAGGYHHHLGINVWNGRGVGPPPPGSVGLRQWTIELPARHDVDAVRERLERAGVPAEGDDGAVVVRDPWQTAVRIESS